MTIAGISYKQNTAKSAKQLPAVSLVLILRRRQYARILRANPQRGRAVQQTSHDTWRCFVYTVTLIVTHEKLSLKIQYTINEAL